MKIQWDTNKMKKDKIKIKDQNNNIYMKIK